MAEESGASSPGSGPDALGAGEHLQIADAGPKWLRGLVDGLDRVLRVALILVMLTMLAAALAQVFVRYALTTTLVGPEEIARYMMIAGTFLAVPVLAKTRNHIAVDALAHYLPGERSRLWLTRLVLMIELAFLAVFSWYALEVVQAAASTGGYSAGLEIPNYIPMIPVFVGGALGLLVTAVLLVQSFYGGLIRVPDYPIDEEAQT